MPDELELEAIAAEHAGRPVTDVEMPLVPKVQEDLAAIKALAKLLATGQRRLLVVDAAGAVTGMLTQQDLVRNLFPVR